jgi:hypothetical protein
MKANDPLAKLLKAAARAERTAPLAPQELSFRVQSRVLAARRGLTESFLFLPLFRRALLCAAAIALIAGGLAIQGHDTPDPYEYPLNYSLATAYLQ